jgi:diacylglycerol kinase family enzyme
VDGDVVGKRKIELRILARALDVIVPEPKRNTPAF